MSKVSAALVKDLRERTGLGMMECKKALIASSGDIDESDRTDEVDQANNVYNVLVLVAIDFVLVALYGPKRCRCCHDYISYRDVAG